MSRRATHANPRTFLARASLLLSLTGAPVADRALAQESDAGANEYGAGLLPVRIAAQTSLTWDGDLALGGRVDYPLVERGLLFSARDEVSISGGLDVAFVSFEGSNPLAFWPTATVVWSLGLTERFAFAPEFGLTAHIDRDGWRGVYPNIGFGGRYFLWRSVALTGRIGWPMAISLGACF